jgi:hypothetical protein
MEGGIYLTNVSDGTKISIINFWYSYLKKEEQPSLTHSILLQFCLSAIVVVFQNKPNRHLRFVLDVSFVSSAAGGAGRVEMTIWRRSEPFRDQHPNHRPIHSLYSLRLAGCIQRRLPLIPARKFLQSDSAHGAAERAR